MVSNGRMAENCCIIMSCKCMSVQEFVVYECHVCAYDTRRLVSTVISTILEEFPLSLPSLSSSSLLLSLLLLS
jgi:hypothetical protein